MKLYVVSITTPVYFRSYYVLADGFDEAADMAMRRDQAGGGRNGGVDKIDIVGWVDDGDGNLLVSPAGLAALKPAKTPSSAK